LAGIYVLSDTLKANSKLKKAPTLKEIDMTDSSENATASFAAMLSGSIKQNPDSKGQYSAKVGLGPDIEKKQSTDDSVQSAQDSNGLGSLLAYGSFVLPLFTQPMYQGDLPAGKEANSGNDNEVTVQSGMTAQKTQGDNPGITELDKYRQVIGNLLGALSGEITNTSGKGISSNTESWGTKDLSQDIAKVVQGWSTLSDNEANSSQASTGQKEIQSTNVLTIAPSTIASSTIKPLEKPLNEKDLTPLKALNPILNQEVEDAKMPQGVLNKEIHKGELTRSTELSVTKVVQNQSSSVGIEGGVGIGVPSNIVASNVAEGKTTAVPVWEQISTVLREHVINKSQDLKQLDIQLHPADLGKIQIDLRWENGQVHLQVQASQASTSQLLQDHLSDLRQALSNQGVNCGMLQMGQGGARQQSSHGDESRRTFNQNIHLDKDEDLSSDTTSLSMGLPGINRINLTA
jgi:flagellar hook-length control protein FliK